MIPSAVELFSPLGLRKCCTGKENFASVAISWSMGKHFSGSLDRFMKLISILVDTTKLWPGCAACMLVNCSNILMKSFFFIILNQVMLSFGAAPASSCGRGNSSALPDYLPEEDDNVVISDKVSKRQKIHHFNSVHISDLSFNSFRQLQGSEEMTKKMDGFPVCPVSLARLCIGENRKETEF